MNKKSKKLWIKRIVILISIISVFSLIDISINSLLRNDYEQQFTLENIVEKVISSVVHIQYQSDNNVGYNNSWQGSGVLIDRSGFILTARHVIEKPGRFIITLTDGRKFTTDKSCINKKFDFGFLKITDVNNPNNFPYAKFGNSNEVKLGEELFAIGSQFGKEHFNSVTSGILSGINRKYDEPEYGWSVLFQTDVGANPGSSGCPVFNMKGEVVGVVVGAPTSMYNGIIYCVPSNICQNYIDNILNAFIMQEYKFVDLSNKEEREKFEALENYLQRELNKLWDSLDIVKNSIEEIKEKEEEEEIFSVD